jgi:hypothetical protein
MPVTFRFVGTLFGGETNVRAARETWILGGRGRIPEASPRNARLYQIPPEITGSARYEVGINTFAAKICLLREGARGVISAHPALTTPTYSPTYSFDLALSYRNLHVPAAPCHEVWPGGRCCNERRQLPKILRNARIRQRKANILIFDECPEIRTISMTAYGVMFCDPFPDTKPQSMTPTNPSKRLQPISESFTKPDPSPPQKRAKLGPDSPSKPDPAVIRLQRAGFLDSLSSPVTRPPEQSTQDDKEASESSGSHLEGRQGCYGGAAANQAHERTLYVDNFAHFWREERGWGGGGGQADEAVLERGREEMIRGCWDSCGSARSARSSQPGHGPGGGISDAAQKLGTLDRQGGKKGTEQGDAEMQ